MPDGVLSLLQQATRYGEVLTLRGVLGKTTLPILRGRLDEFAGDRSRRRLILDLYDLVGMDCAGLELLLSTARGLESGRCLVALVAPASEAERILDVGDPAETIERRYDLSDIMSCRPSGPCTGPAPHVGVLIAGRSHSRDTQA